VLKTINIPVKYIDTRQYIIEAHADDVSNDSPADWDNFEIVTFGRNRFITDCDPYEYYTDNGKLKPAYQAKVKAGKMFGIDIYEHSGVSFTLHNEGMPNDWDTSSNAGFIIFNDAYIKGTTFEQRQEYARQDLKTYTQWANGEVYGVRIKTDTGLVVEDWLYGIYDVDDYAKDILGNDAEYEVIYK